MIFHFMCLMKNVFVYQDKSRSPRSSVMPSESIKYNENMMRDLKVIYKPKKATLANIS